jgi:hypothetical protein
MTLASRSLALSFAFLGAASVGVHAESSLVSSASQSLSTSVGQMSKSISNSSDGSSKHQDLAQGDYQVIDVADAADRPGMVALKLQPVAAGAAAFTLTVPAETVAKNGIAAGQVVSALARPYGFEFAKADTQQAFFLVMNDDWHRELKSNLVS